MAKMQLLITDKTDKIGIKPLKKYFRIDFKSGLKLRNLEKIIGNYEAVITRSSTGISRELIEKASRLKIIGRVGIGVDNIDIFASTERKIAVINAPKGNARVTAEHTIGLIISLLRHIPQAHTDLKKGIWGKTKYVGTQVFGKTLGIVGFGNVGKEVCRIADGLGMEVMVCEPYIKIPKKVRKMTFEDLLSASDIVTFHVPLTYLTRGMINKKTVFLLKKGAYLINCSRGGVVEDNAVFQALKSGHIAGFAADVYQKEPFVDKRLFRFPNYIATPHIAGSTVESQKQSVEEVTNGIITYIQGKVPVNLLNPQVFIKRKRMVKKWDFDSVIFDCDSTLSTIEGIDELAGFVGKKAEVAKLTKDAMNGLASFEEIFEKRLKMIKPNHEHLEKVGQMYINTLVADAKGVIEALRYLGKDVYIVSSSYTQALFKLGEYLGLFPENIFGNDLLHDKKGNYQIFIDGPLRRNHGKLQIIRQIAGRKIMIGDSVTDLETRECVDLFVGFGGVMKREKVERESELYLYTKSLSPVLIIAAGIDGCMKLVKTKYRRFVGKGMDLLSDDKYVKVEKGLLPRLRELRKLAYY